MYPFYKEDKDRDTYSYYQLSNTECVPLERYPKKRPPQPKIFIRDETIVYERSKDKHSTDDSKYKSLEKRNNNSKHTNNMKSTQEEIEAFFSPAYYNMFNYERNTSSDEYGSDISTDEESNDDEYEKTCDADDEATPGELNEDDIEIEGPYKDYVPPEEPGKDLDETYEFGPPKLEYDIETVEKYRHLFSEVGKRTTRPFPKRMIPNPEYTGGPKEDEEAIPVNEDDIKMPPGTPDEEWYPKPGDPEYFVSETLPPGIEWKPFNKQFLSEEEFTDEAYSCNSDYITETDENYSTETYIDSDELSSCPEDGPEYPYIPEEAYIEPKANETTFDFQKIPEGNPEVRIWYDVKGREYIDAKNDTGEWETVEQVVVEYPPKPKGPGQWEAYKRPSKPDGCTCGELDFTGFYDEHSKYQRPKTDETDMVADSPEDKTSENVRADDNIFDEHDNTAKHNNSSSSFHMNTSDSVNDLKRYENGVKLQHGNNRFEETSMKNDETLTRNKSEFSEKLYSINGSMNLYEVNNCDQIKTSIKGKANINDKIKVDPPSIVGGTTHPEIIFKIPVFKNKSLIKNHSNAFNNKSKIVPTQSEDKATKHNGSKTLDCTRMRYLEEPFMKDQVTSLVYPSEYQNKISFQTPQKTYQVT